LDTLSLVYLVEKEKCPSDLFFMEQGAVRISVSVPNVEGEANLNGQTLELTVLSLSESIKSLKERIAGEVQMAANKQKLSSQIGFLKDNLSLAFYNIGPGDILALGLKERGGRR
jgi:splicing factor 3A subunit 1